MANYTKHYNLIKPEKSDNYNIEDVTIKNADIIDEKLFEKQEKQPGKGLSTNDFTNEYKNKLDNLENYDDTTIKENISNLKTQNAQQNTNIQKNTEDIIELNDLIGNINTILDDINGSEV